MEKKDMVILSLEYFKQNSLEGIDVDVQHLMNYLNENGIPLGENEKSYIKQLHREMCYNNFDPGPMKLDAYLGLLDYEELKQARLDSQEARNESKTAVRLAMWSLILATLVGIAQIIVAIVYS